MTDIVEIMARAIYESHEFVKPWDEANHWHDLCRAETRAAITALSEAGFAIVPIEPTEDMETAGEMEMQNSDIARLIYTEMVAAAQKGWGKE